MLKNFFRSLSFCIYVFICFMCTWGYTSSLKNHHSVPEPFNIIHMILSLVLAVSSGLLFNYDFILEHIFTEKGRYKTLYILLITVVVILLYFLYFKLNF